MRISEARRFAGIALLTALAAAGSAEPPRVPSPGWRDVGPDYVWSFPRDHRVHRDYRNEWWYFTGHLEAIDEPRRFAFQLIFFRIGVAPTEPGHDSSWDTANLVLGHAAITDKDLGEHRFSEVLWRESPLLAGFGDALEPRIVWARAPAGDDGEWSVSHSAEGFALVMSDRSLEMRFELGLRPEREPLLHGENGYSRKAGDPLAASLYYSHTRLAANGTLTLGEQRFSVRGESWLDREVSTRLLVDAQVGWDWFSIRLDDGLDVMLYRLRRADGRIDWAGGTLFSPGLPPRKLSAGEWSATPGATWRSPTSGVEYPVEWVLDVPAERLHLRLRADVAGQENRSRLGSGLTYWEGAVSAYRAGEERVGSGFVELTGYGEENRPPL